jgi:hypothetical protein
MKILKLIAAILTFSLSFNCNAQILLKDYKCLFLDGQVEDISCHMYKRNDTFSFTSFHRDIYMEIDDAHNNPKNRLKAGLDYCFGGTGYFKTKDSLYISTGRSPDSTFYYAIYLPDYEEVYFLHSNQNDADFSQKSKWLLSQIRLYRGKPMYFINEKRETCRNENDLYETP